MYHCTHILEDISSGNNTNFCVMPWIGFAGDSDGSFRLCCVDLDSRKNQDFGNIKDKNIDTYRESTTLSQVRKKMLRGEKIRNCNECYKRESQGFTSKRLESLKKYYSGLEKIIESTDSITGQTNFYFQYFDIRFSNICNLACRMCFSRYSTSRIEIDKALGFQEEFGTISGIWDIEKFIDSPEFLSHIETISVAGGEPFLDPDQEKFIDFLIERGMSKKIQIKYNTNLTVISEVFLEKLKNFRSVHITISCDGYKESYEYIRIGAKWGTFLHNFLLLQKISRDIKYNMSLSIHIVAQRDNIMDIPKLLLFLEKFKNLKIKLTILTNPEYLFIGNIELGEREKIIKIYNYYIEKYLYAFPDLQESLQNIIKTLEIVEPHSFNKEEYRHKKNIIDSFLK